ncbi:amino acid/amide ABC transporter substrate-binding protein, HAAT family [Thioclava sp. ES.031]|uniref:transporter substrate-binding protein n=1 Tax=Thioclava sp. ES.031 TaxID=1798203 RepID=UPI000BFA138C|nr:transporter substrate-binding protein [Thioclava sp. ES.031]PFG63186.1 amino acid/amide ABC transporter substrate-binding protein, HAAT family [Thioclava sp. ES.031]
MKKRIELGLLYSRSGSYSLISEACRTGALSAIAEINSMPDLPITFAPIERDPQGNIDAYGPLCEEILRDSDARHVVGCVTSWSRKEVIPTLEKAGGTLWYAVPYEGFEASDHVVYTHACPNQHLLPLLGWAFARLGRRGFLTGSNYIWGWEMNRLARDVILSASGEVLGERYLPLGSLDVERMINEIRATRPDFILNNLIGPSQYAFLEAYHKLGQEDAHFRPETCPILSCNLTECELPAIHPDAVEGLVAAGPYFRGATGWPQAERNFGSSHEAAAWSSVYRLAILLSGHDDAAEQSLAQLLHDAPQGSEGIDLSTHHTALPVLIAQVENGAFAVRERFEAVAGDPYLARGRNPIAPGAPRLKVVS